MSSWFNKKTVANGLAILSVLLVLFTLLTMMISEEMACIIFLGLLIVYTFLTRPTLRTGGWLSHTVDGLLILGITISSVYLLINFNDLVGRVGVVNTTDVVMGIIAVICILEATRRAMGLSLSIIAIVFMVYAFLGPYLPSILGHRGYDMERVISASYLTNQGIYGVPLKTMVRYVVLFVIFGSILEVAGASMFLIDLSRAIAGRVTGGMAQVAIWSSALLGSVNGSAVANVVVTGAVTIPAMKKRGYEAKMAAAIEAISSSGGQFLPPIMGAAAFLMAEYLGISYWKVALYATLPALMFFVGNSICIYIHAKQNGIHGESKEELPKLSHVLFKSGYKLLPLLVLIGMMFMGYTTTYAGIFGVISAILVLLLSKGIKTGLPLLGSAFIDCGRSIASLSVATATAGIVVSMITLTGLGTHLAGILVTLSGNNLLLLLVLVMMVSIIMGMGMPTTVVYIMLATLVVPAMIELGVEPIAAHLFILFFGCMSMITPPVALASYAGAAIAEANPDQTGWIAFRLALPTFLIPFFYIYNPEFVLLNAPVWEIMLSFVRCLILITAFSCITMGFLKGSWRWIGNFLFATIGISFLIGGLIGVTSGLIFIFIGYFMYKYEKITLSRPKEKISI